MEANIEMIVNKAISLSKIKPETMTMITFTTRLAFPTDTFEYFAMILERISRPPCEPPLLKTIPHPIPLSVPPKIAANKVLSVHKCCNWNNI